MPDETGTSAQRPLPDCPRCTETVRVRRVDATGLFDGVELLAVRLVRLFWGTSYGKRVTDSCEDE